MKNCKYCQGTGICYEPSGYDDVMPEICPCGQIEILETIQA